MLFALYTPTQLVFLRGGELRMEATIQTMVINTVLLVWEWPLLQESMPTVNRLTSMERHLMQRLSMFVSEPMLEQDRSKIIFFLRNFTNLQ